MSDQATIQTVQQFLNWVEQGDQGLVGWIRSVENDPQKMQRIAEIYRDIKAAFGF